MHRLLILFVLAAASAVASGQPPAAPKIFLDAAPRAVDYQLSRLTNDELTRVERKPEDARYKPVYLALLTRPGLAPQYADEAIAALSKLTGETRSGVLLEGLAKVDAKDGLTADRLLRMLLRQPAATLAKERAAFARAIEGRGAPFVLQAAYGAMMTADGDPRAAWEAASARGDSEVLYVLRSVPHLGDRNLRVKLFEPVAAVLGKSQDPAVRAAAVTALGWTREDAATFRLIARHVLEGDDEVRAAGVTSLQRLPKEAWPAGEVEPLARALVTSLGNVALDRRTDPANIDTMQLAETLAATLPDPGGSALRRDLRALGVRVVRIETVPEEMLFDVKWFAVEAGKPVQIVFFNPDAMSHNLLITKPGAMKEVGVAAGTMNVSADPSVKAYVPDTPLVLQSTRLLNWGETERLNFAAPKEPGEYPFVCTFPGHWARMYGVMLVVPSLDAWEAKRTTPSDPITGKAFASPRSK